MGDSRATSTSAIIATLAANSVLLGLFTVGFLLLRVKFKRIFSPRSSYDIAPKELRPPELSKDPISWIWVLAKRSHSQMIQQAGLDGYFYLRFMIIMCLIFLGGILTWTVLLPVNATNGRGHDGFDQLSISNVIDSDRYYAHVLIGWIFYGLVVFVIYRELFFYNSLRCAALSSPKYAKKLSSRTVLFQSVPNNLLDEKQFFKLFNGVKRIYVVRHLRKLTAKVSERDDLVNRLEKAENLLLKSAMKAKLKAEKKNNPIPETDDINAYVPRNKRPRHKVNGMFSSKVDTIEYCLDKLPEVEREVRKLQKLYKTAKPKNSLFVEFENQYQAQLAYQSTIHHNPLRMSPVFTGMEPGDVVWSNLRLFWWEKYFRSMIAVGAITAIIILWAIPVAFIGVISNITYLTNKLPWLRWILNLPSQLLGIVTGLLPTAMIMTLFILLPMVIRALGLIAGCPTVQEIELFAHSSHFTFLLVNLFVVVTLASSASSVVTQIVNDPTSAMQLLATNLPKASNFFISFIIFQGWLTSGSTLFQIVSLILFYFLGGILDKTVRKKWTRFNTLDGTTWGTTFGAFANLACITFSYAIISPMILIFSCVAFFLIFIAMSYVITYILVPGPEVRGLHYPKALFQIFIGIYFGQICLLGIFVVGKGWGPIVLQAIGLGATAFCHYSLSQSFDRLMHVVPIDTMKPLDGVSQTPSFNGKTDYKEKVIDRRNRKHHNSHVQQHDLERTIEEDQEVTHQIKQDLLDPDVEMHNNDSMYSVTPLLADRDFKKLESNNPLVRFLRPDVFLNYRHAKSILPAVYNEEPEEVDDKHAYDYPVVALRLPIIWIPQDPMGLSKVEIENAKKAISMSDENASFNEKGEIIFTGPPPE